jgi:hypothetical protein
MHTLKVSGLQKTADNGARLRGFLGVVVSVAIAATAIFALTHALKNVNYAEVLGTILSVFCGPLSKAQVATAAG